jgi:trehalose/maltose hydrolase-like predicted phosphorylase
VDATRFEAIIVDSSGWSVAAAGLEEALRARCDDLRAAGMVVHDVDSGDAAAIAEIAASLAARGITGRLIAVVGDKLAGHGDVPELRRAVHTPTPDDDAGFDSLIRLLDHQLSLRADRRVPAIDDDPSWVVPLPTDPVMDRVSEALGTLANGWVGVRGRREDRQPATVSPMLVSGVYTDADGQPRLLAAPDWTTLTVDVSTDGSQLLDLRSGLLLRRGRVLRTLRLVSAARLDAMGLRAEGRASTLGHPAALAPGDSSTPIEVCTAPKIQAARARSSDGGGITVAVQDHENIVGKLRVIERLATVAADQRSVPDWDRVTNQLDDLVATGFDRLLADHREAWAQRWANARVDIEGSPGDELAARFAVFHLLGSTPGEGEAAVGARGLSGPAYGGHVFWDADVFVLPALAAIHPAAARAMLEYRIGRLPAARRAAQAVGLAGARFPWESAATGRDVTPRRVMGTGGEVIPIHTGEWEEHIVADVAWAASEYVSWTGQPEFLHGPGADLVLDTARYWASRVTTEGDGRGHIRGVIGPDEYHEDVDDNAFTNVMARWNLRRGADLADDKGLASEAAGWRQIAASLFDGWDAERQLYEQFAGYWSLEPLLIDQVAVPPVAADVLLGDARVRGSQLIKQADVLMVHHLVPEEVEPGSLRPNLSFYEARTAHGSSLSPAIHAALLARCGEPDRALVPFRMAARLDLDDLTGTTSGGLHLATMGGLWQALAYGFCGLRPGRDLLNIDPQLPSEWSALALHLLFHDAPVRIRAEHDRVVIDCTCPLTVRIGAGRPQSCRPPGHTFATGDGHRHPQRTTP